MHKGEVIIFLILPFNIQPVKTMYFLLFAL